MNSIINLNQQTADNADIEPRCLACPAHRICTHAITFNRFSYCAIMHTPVHDWNLCPEKE